MQAKDSRPAAAPRETRRGRPNARAGTRRPPARDVRPCGLRLLRLVRFLRGEADDLHAGAPGHVHRLDHVLVDPVRPGLDEQQLGRTLVVDRVDLGIQLVLGDRLAVDGVPAVVGQLQHDLAGRRLVGLWSSSGGGTCTSSAIRESGCVIMKMISSTSSTSIIGVTLMSDCTPRRMPPRSSPCYFFSFLSCRPRTDRCSFGSVMAAITRTPARRAVSTASWILAYFSWLSALKYRILSSVRAAKIDAELVLQRAARAAAGR